MYRTILALLLAVVRATGAQAPPPAQGPDTTRAVIQGSVRDSLGIAIDGASVLVRPGGLIFRTDSAGRFVARGIPVGNLSLTVRRLGLSPLESQVTVHPGTTVTVDLVMRRLPQVLAQVEINAAQNRQCPRFSLDGILCRREVGKGQFMNREEIVATGAIFPQHVLRDLPGFRVNLNGDPRRIESIAGWRCMEFLVDGRPPSRIDPVPRVRDMFAVEVYQPDEAPPEYRQWVWRGAYPCTLVIFWSSRVGRQANRVPRQE